MKILFIKNIPWLQRVVEYKLVDSRGITQSDEYKGLDFLKRKLQKQERNF